MLGGLQQGILPSEIFEKCNYCNSPFCIPMGICMQNTLSQAYPSQLSMVQSAIRQMTNHESALSIKNKKLLLLRK